MQTVSHVSRSAQVAPKTGGWVTVAPDGPVYRWRRNDGRTTRTSSEAFLTPAAAIEAGQSIARCYGVRFVAVSWNAGGAN